MESNKQIERTNLSCVDKRKDQQFRKPSDFTFYYPYR